MFKVHSKKSMKSLFWFYLLHCYFYQLHVVINFCVNICPQTYQAPTPKTSTTKHHVVRPPKTTSTESPNSNNTMY